MYSWSTWSGILKNLITFEKYIQLLNYYVYLGIEYEEWVMCTCMLLWGQQIQTF